MLAAMMLLRRAGERGHTDAGWLDSRHTFSFGEYHDPAAMGFRVLRVLNDDRVAPGGGFPTHGHRDMEIVSYVLEGGLEHRDSLGTGSVIRPGDVQRMSAGTGVRHSEFNASQSDSVHFLQIWILPERAGLAPGYEQKHVPDADKRGRFRLIASHDGRDGSVTIHQDTAIYAALLETGQRTEQALSAGRHAYLHVARGEITVGDQDLGEGDGAAFAEVSAIEVVGRGPAEVLLFDMP
jgi:redox-sensitive bicupin YhaK (pirin superfamily)